MGKNKQMSPSLSATAVVTFSLRRNDGHADVDHLLPRGRRSGWNLFLLFVATGCHHEAIYFATLYPWLASPSYLRNTPSILPQLRNAIGRAFSLANVQSNRLYLTLLRE